MLIALVAFVITAALLLLGSNLGGLFKATGTLKQSGNGASRSYTCDVP